MQLIWEDEEYTLDLDEMDTVEARYIKKRTGLTPIDLQDALFKVDPDAMCAIYWLMMRQSQKPVKDIENLNIKLVKYAEAVVKAYAAELDAQGGETDEVEGDPKAPGQ